MQVEIKQNCYSGQWWIKPACASSRLVLRENHMDNGMLTNARVAELAGRAWLQRYMFGEVPTNAWHVIDVPIGDILSARASAAQTAWD